MSLPQQPKPPIRPLRLAREAREQIAALAHLAYPFEGCGVLLGTRIDGVALVKFASQAPNRADRPDRFELDPGHLVQMHRLAESSGLEALGTWHSHPDQPAVPSQHDNGAAWPGQSCVIVTSTSEGSGPPRSWLMDRGVLQEQAIGDPGKRACVQAPPG